MYTYLGSNVYNNVRTDGDIKTGIQKWRGNFKAIGNMWKATEIKLKLAPN